ncbi:MAG: WG repeat-containing protein [Lachnospiraceae bacterium]|nr:WG repeat-containing protein [Lachnospiraceae bacterium]
MKKRLAVICLFAAMAMSTAALADITITPTGKSFTDTEWIDGSNLMMAGGYGEYCMEDADGNALTGADYTGFEYAHGYIKCRVRTEDVNNYGVLTQAGDLIIPCEYGDIRIENGSWALGIKLVLADANNYDYESWFSSEDKYYLIETVDVYHLTGDSAVLAGSLPRENFMAAEAEGDYIKIQNRADETVTLYDGAFQVVAQDLRSIYDDVEQAQEYVIFTENGQQGIADLNGNVLAAPAFRYVYDILEDGYAYVTTGDKYGLIDLTGKVVVPAEYDNLRKNYYGAEDYDGYVAAGYVACERDGKAAFCDLNGNETLEAKYAKDNVEVNGASALLTDMEGNVRILAADGVETVLDKAHSDARVLYYGNGLLYRFTDEDYNYGLMDWHGNELLPAQYDSIELSGDGSILLVNTDYSNCEQYTVDYGMDDVAEGSAEAGTQDVTGGDESAQDTGSSDVTPLGALFDSISTLVKSDFEANRGAVAALVDTAASMLAENQGDIKTILESVSSLVSSGLGDAASITALLDTAKALLG